MNDARVSLRGDAVQRAAHGVAAVAALGVLIDALSDQSVWPRGPLAAAALLLGLGLVAGQVVQRLNGRSVHGAAQIVAATAALVVLIAELSSNRPWWSPRWPELIPALILGLGLVAGPFVKLVTARSTQGLARLVVTVVALVVLVRALSDANVWPHWPVTAAAVLLGLGLAAGPVVQRATGRLVHGAAQAVASFAALAVLVLAMSIDPYSSPRWPEVVTALILGAGLLAVTLVGRVAGDPRERVLSARVDQLSRTRRGALDVQASELRRIERDLHDGAQVRLVALSMKLGRAEERYRHDEPTATLLREAREDATAAIRELRELARGIAPPVLTDRGLEAAVRSLAHRSGIEVRVSGDLRRRPLPPIENAAYFVVAESLTNAAKHAAGARVEIRLDERGGDLFVEITDFGPGGANPTGGGLTGLRQRVEALDGVLHVTSPSGVGTQVEAVLPCVS